MLRSIRQAIIWSVWAGPPGAQGRDPSSCVCSVARGCGKHLVAGRAAKIRAAPRCKTVAIFVQQRQHLVNPLG
jgi:hypothetical protein